MKRFNLVFLVGLFFLSNTIQANEYRRIEDNKVIKDCGGCIGGMSFCFVAIAGLTVFAIVNTRGDGGSNRPQPILCENPPKMLGYKGISDITGCWSLIINCMKEFPFENILPVDAFHVGKFNGNNTAAQLYAQDLIRKNCLVIRHNPKSCGLCFQSSDTCNADNLFESKVYELRDYSGCMNEKSTRSALDRLNVTQNRTRQQRHQKQNFRQHMRGRNKRG